MSSHVSQRKQSKSLILMVELEKTGIEPVQWSAESAVQCHSRQPLSRRCDCRIIRLIRCSSVFGEKDCRPASRPLIPLSCSSFLLLFLLLSPHKQLPNISSFAKQPKRSMIPASPSPAHTVNRIFLKREREREKKTAVGPVNNNRNKVNPRNLQDSTLFPVRFPVTRRIMHFFFPHFLLTSCLILRPVLVHTRTPLHIASQSGERAVAPFS